MLIAYVFLSMQRSLFSFNEKIKPKIRRALEKIAVDADATAAATGAAFADEFQEANLFTFFFSVCSFVRSFIFSQ